MGLVYCLIQVLLSVVSSAVSMVVDKVFATLNKRERKSVSKVEDPLLLTPASVLAEKIRTRQLRAEDVMTAYVTRAKEVNDLVNGVIGQRYEEALSSARQLDATLDSLTKEEIQVGFSRQAKPLLGVPMSVKGSITWKGMSLANGMVSRRHIRAEADAPALARLQEAGAIPFVQTNVPELSYWIETSNNLHGRTNNPYDLARGVGGSSGGEGCLIGAGASVFGIGSDIGGSIRIPSAFNGTFGHKPSTGVVSHEGHHAPITEDFVAMFTMGPLCRYASDLLPVVKVMAKPEMLPKLRLDAKVDVTALRVISVPDDGGGVGVRSVEPELKAVQVQALNFLKDLGADVIQQRVTKFREAFDVWFAKFDMCGKRQPWFCELLAGPTGGRLNPITELFLKCLGRSNHTVAAILFGITQTFLPKVIASKELKDMETLEQLRKEMTELLGDNGVLLYPTFPTEAPYHHRPLFNFLDMSYAALPNALGFPVTQCTLGLSKADGLPLGIQVMAAPLNDRLTLAVARWLEEGFGGWVSPGLQE